MMCDSINQFAIFRTDDTMWPMRISIHIICQHLFHVHFVPFAHVVLDVLVELKKKIVCHHVLKLKHCTK